MIKIFFRTLFFLGLAGLISAGLYLYSQSTSAQSFAADPGRPGQESRQFAEEQFTEGQFPERPFGSEGIRGMPGERGEGGFSLLRGLPEVLKNLVVIGLIVAIVAGLQKALKITTN